MGLFAFRRCFGHYLFVLACESLNIPSLCQSFFLSLAAVWVFLRFVAASAIYSLCWRAGLFALRRCVIHLVFLVCVSVSCVRVGLLAFRTRVFSQKCKPI